VRARSRRRARARVVRDRQRPASVAATKRRRPACRPCRTRRRGCPPPSAASRNRGRAPVLNLHASPSFLAQPPIPMDAACRRRRRGRAPRRSRSRAGRSHSGAPPPRVRPAAAPPRGARAPVRRTASPPTLRLLQAATASLAPRLLVDVDPRRARRVVKIHARRCRPCSRPVVTPRP
jgi:hypothetical protein